MKKRAKIAISIASIIAAALAVFIIIEIIKSNEYFSYPLYDTYENESGIKSFSIDGVEYTLINNRWRIDENEKGEIIGFIDNHQPVYTTIGDSNVLCVQIPSESVEYAPYFHSDYVLPDMSISNIDKINWIDPADYSRKTSNDKDLIEALSYEISSNEHINTENEGMLLVTWVDCYFRDTPEVYLPIYIWILWDGSLVCDYYGIQTYQYCEISIDLFERILGHKLDDKYVKSIRENES